MSAVRKQRVTSSPVPHQTNDQQRELFDIAFYNEGKVERARGMTKAACTGIGQLGFETVAPE